MEVETGGGGGGVESDKGKEGLRSSDGALVMVR